MGIRPLPNLETKFVAANTLISLDRPAQFIFPNVEIEAKERDLRQVRESHFTARTNKEKVRFRGMDNRLRSELAELLLQPDFSREQTAKLAQWDPYDQNASADFFDPEWMFGVRVGFDVVIGNPPYIQLQKDGGKLANILGNRGYKTFERTGDIYALFYERGVEALKNRGFLCFITSNKWMRAGYGESLRKYFLSKNPQLLIDLGPGIFENATVDTNILIVQNTDNTRSLKGVTLSFEAKEKGLSDFVASNAVSLPKITSEAWFVGNNAQQKLKEKIAKFGKPLKEWDVKIYRGVVTGFNEAFVIDNETKELLCNQDPKCAKMLKPILRGRDIKRYSYEWAGRWLIHTGFDINIPKLYPGIYRHLLQFEARAKVRDDQGKNWWNLRACTYYDEFEKEKVIWKRIGSVLRFGYDTAGVYCQDSTCIMTGSDLKYLCAYLNSKLGNSLLFDRAPKTGTGDVIVSVQALEPLLIAPLTYQNRPIVKRIEQSVDKILANKRQNATADIRPLEEEIDRLVYQLFDLTNEEIAIVEKSTHARGSVVKDRDQAVEVRETAFAQPRQPMQKVPPRKRAKVA